MRLKNKIFESLSKSVKLVKAFIRKDGSSDKPYCVYTHQTGKNMGCYKTKKQAEKRLSQIHMFSD